MKGKTLAAIAAAALALCLAGCSQGGGAGESSSSAPSEPLQPEIVTSGCGEPDDFGYINFWGVLSNPNEGYEIENPGFRATAYDADGNVIDTQEYPTYLSSKLIVLPGEKFAMNGVLSVGSSEVSEVKIEPICEDTPKASGAEPNWEIANTSANPSDIGWVTAAGEISNNGEDAASYMVSCVLYDADGNSVDAGFTWADDVPAGGSIPFSINCMAGTTDFDHAEFYATQNMNA